MAPSSSSSPSKSPFTPLHQSLHFTPILECEEDDLHEDKYKNRTPQTQNDKPTNKKRHNNNSSVSCNKCRPLENPSFVSSPNLIIKSIFQSLTRKTPKKSPREEQWRLAVTELSNKLIQTTKKKQDAILEASKLKSSMVELEKKLNKLEIYCHNLKSDLDQCSNKKQSVLIQQFLVSVSDSRSSIRALSRSLASQLRTVGGKVYERLSLLLQPFDVKISNPKSLIFYLEAILSRTFFEDFEVSGSTRVLNPIDRCEFNYDSFNVLMELTWDEVLSRGTKHFSEEFSGFCDRKMSDIVSLLCWNRAWPEPLLKAFFGASKCVWLVHLLANSVNPSLQIFRVEKDARFDPIYMEETGGNRFKSLVRVMVQPGFYVYGSVVKCKVICKNCNTDEEEIEDSTFKECNKNDKSLISSCSPLGG